MKHIKLIKNSYLSAILFFNSNEDELERRVSVIYIDGLGDEVTIWNSYLDELLSICKEYAKQEDLILWSY